MKTRILGKDLTVSAIGLGCMGFSHAYGAPIPEQETISLLRQAVDVYKRQEVRISTISVLMVQINQIVFMFVLLLKLIGMQWLIC